MSPIRERLFHGGPRLALAIVLTTILQTACGTEVADGTAGRLSELVVADTPSLVLGSALDNPEQQFQRVADARFIGDTAVLVASSGTHDMRLFGLTGRLLKTYGREGRGPGENESIGGFVVRSDTLWSFDWGLRRTTLWSLEHGYAKSFNWPSGGEEPIWMIKGIFLDGSLLGISAPRSESMAGGTTDQSVDLIRWPPESSTTSRLDPLFWHRTFILLVSGAGYSGSSGYRNPFSGTASITVSGAGYWYTDSRSASLQRYSIEGEIQDTVQLPFALLLVTNADREALERTWMDGAQGQSRQRLQTVLDQAHYPETLPAITSLVVAHDGSVWAGRYVREGDTLRTWYIISDDGEVIKRVTLPAGFTLFDVADDRVLGVRRDENDVENVVVFPLESGPGSISAYQSPQLPEK